MICLKDKKVMVTGGQSMIGGATCTALEKRGAIVDRVPHSECNLLEYDKIDYRIYNFSPNYIIHAAGFNGGLNFNKQFPASIYGKTAEMAINVLCAASVYKIPKVVSILPSCAYSYQDKEGWTREILSEENFTDGAPHPSVECHGLAKRILFDYSRQIHKQYNLNYVCAILNNCYGPRDSFDINKTKVVGALVKKFVEAKRTGAPYVEVFGTGAAKREFLFSEDAGEGIVRVLESYDDPTLPINLGSGKEISIKKLAEKISGLVEYDGEIKYLVEYGDGQLRKLLSDVRTKELLNWSPKTRIDIGLMKTIEYYEENY
jgi:GDP-L-fucose synthase